MSSRRGVLVVVLLIVFGTMASMALWLFVSLFATPPPPSVPPSPPVVPSSQSTPTPAPETPNVEPSAQTSARLAREAERTQVQGSYDATALWLQGLQGQLSNANAALEASTGQLGALQTCVAGATEALNQAAAGDSGGLANTVRGIEDVCAQAGVQL